MDKKLTGYAKNYENIKYKFDPGYSNVMFFHVMHNLHLQLLSYSFFTHIIARRG